MQPVTPLFLPLYPQGDLQQLLQLFSQAVNTWRAMAAHAALLEYHAAAEVISTSEALAKAFYVHCHKVTAQAQC